MFVFSTAIWFWMMLATLFQSSAALPTNSLFARQGSCMSIGRPATVNPAHTGRQELTPALRSGTAVSYYNPNTEVEVRMAAADWPNHHRATFNFINEGPFDQTVFIEAHLEGPAQNHPNVVLSEQIDVPGFQTVANRCLQLPPGHRWYVRAVRGPSRKV